MYININIYIYMYIYICIYVYIYICNNVLVPVLATNFELTALFL